MFSWSALKVWDGYMRGKGEHAKDYREKVFFPLFVDISEKTCVVIGAGRIAARRIRTLADFCGDIRVVAPEAVPAVCAMARRCKKSELYSKRKNRPHLYSLALCRYYSVQPK